MSRNMDAGHKETEDVLKQIEARITKEYALAEKEVREKLDDYLRRFQIKDELKRKALANGVITQAEYDQWRIGQIMVGERWSMLADTLAVDYANAAQIAKQIAFGEMPLVYAINFNFGTYAADVMSGGRLADGFTLYNRDAVAVLFKEQEFYHAPGRKVTAMINAGKQVAWDKKQVQSAMMQSILQGESIPNMATRLAKTVGESDRKAAIRNARTMATGVQNAGRVDSFRRSNSIAEKYGMKVRKQWLATLDGRTRHWHAELDGEVVDNDEPFVNDYGEIDYPGDPGAEPANIYNCRCSCIPFIDGAGLDNSLHPNDTGREMADDLEGISYEEWKEGHYEQHSDSITKQDEIAEAMKWHYTAEYRQYAKLTGTPNDDNIKGAISGALDPYSQKADEHAERYYGLVRSMTTDVERIASNTGFAIEDISKIKSFIFLDEHNLGGVMARFAPDYDMAESWQRLIEGKIEKHDITMLNHELTEMKLMAQGMTQSQAHIEASKVFNYSKEVREYNDKIRKHK
ncbi:MAG: hypothetical protein IKX20_02925 [Paludibacteraceae bacterium]|nr:hypothetical protein [Paludibacteraceae bacterium]